MNRGLYKGLEYPKVSVYVEIALIFSLQQANKLDRKWFYLSEIKEEIVYLDDPLD